MPLRILDPIRLKRLLRDLKQALGAHAALVHAPGDGVDDVAVRELDVQPHEVALARDDHARAVVRVHSGLGADVREVRVRDLINDSPDGVYIK